MLGAWFQHSRRDCPPLQIALVLDGLTVPRYAAQVVDDVLGSNFVRIALVVLTDIPAAVPEDGSSALFGLYAHFDRPPDPGVDPLQLVNVADKLKGFATVHTTASVPSSNPDLDAALARHTLDVVLAFSARDTPSVLIDAAAHGVWAFQFGHAVPGHPESDYYEEVRGAEPLSASRLVRLAHEPRHPATLAECIVETQPGLSIAANRPRAYWAVNPLMIRTLHALHERGAEAVRPIGEQNLPPHDGHTKVPTSAAVAGWLAPAIVRKTAQKLTRSERIRHWQLAIRRGGVPLPAQSGPPDVSRFTWIDAPRGRFFADPFLLEHEGRPWVLFEDYDHVAHRGGLSAAIVESDGRLGEVIPMLARPYHLSYPCVFRDRGDLFMIPETGGNGTVELYRCRRFPSEWVFEKVLFQGRAVDTSVWIEDGRFWFFVTVVEPRGRATQLWLFTADSIDAPWTLHPASPLSTDVRRSRNAGAVFRMDGKLIRPSQDGSGRYGRRFGFNEITRLTVDEYAERPMTIIDPPAGFVGTHTYARLGDLELIDGCLLVDAGDPRLSAPR